MYINMYQLIQDFLNKNIKEIQSQSRFSRLALRQLRSQIGLVNRSRGDMLPNMTQCLAHFACGSLAAAHHGWPLPVPDVVRQEQNVLTRGFAQHFKHDIYAYIAAK